VSAVAVCCHQVPTGQLSLAIPSWVGAMSTSQKVVKSCGWGVKVGMVRVGWQVKLCVKPLLHTADI